MTLCGSRMLSLDMHFFYGWLSNENSQRRIDFIGLVYMVPIGAHSVSATMKITTTCSLNAPIRKHYGGIVLGHVVSSRGLEVDKAKIDVISSLPYPSCVREIRSFLGHAGFYRRFIKDFSKITSPLCKLLAKEVDFVFDQACKDAHDELKRRVTFAPII